MGRCLYVQDDSGFAPLCAWTRTDGYGASIGDPPVVAALERRYGLDLGPLRRIAEDDAGDGLREAEPWLRQVDLPLDDIPEMALAPLRAAAAAQRAQNEAAWTPATEMLDLLARLRAALGSPGAPADAELLRLLAEKQGPLGFHEPYVTEGFLHQEVVDLLFMTRWAIARGADRVRLWVQ